MDTAAAVAAWPGLYADRPHHIDSRACDYTNVPGADLAYFTLMFDEGRFVGYGGSNGDVPAPGGGNSGMSAAALQALYHDALQSAPDRFARGAGELLSMRADAARRSRLVFRIGADGKVAEWRVGLLPQVDYDEGCQSAPG